MSTVGVDIGGTFTDFVVAEAGGSVRIHKRPSTPSDPSEAFLLGLDEADVAVRDLTKAVHGTTVGTNTLIERRGARTGLITTRGFRDVLEIARSAKPPSDYFNLRWRQPEPLVPRELREEVTERITADGTVLEPLDEDDCLRALERLVENGCDAVAVCLLFSYANPIHERRIRELAAEHHPELVVSTSSELLPQWREYERTSTTVADAFIKPRLGHYFTRLESTLRSQGLRNNLLIMKSNGGLMTARTASTEPIHTFLSGPSAGALAGKFIGESAGHANVITMDMGGTSFDVSLVREGQLAERMEGEIEAGVPVLIPMIDIRTIGAGGGSIGWIDAGGALKVGPESAGADPGPACYGRGGSRPTITDANLVLGRLGRSARLGGALELDPDLSVRALATELGARAGLDVQTAANGMITICVANMVHEVRAISAQQGFDPRDFALVAAGGAGPLHATLIADALDIATVIVPPHPGLLSASGLLLADLKFDVVRSWPFVLERSSLEPLLEALQEMLDRGLETLRAEGHEGEVRILRSLDMRYQGQNWEINVPLNRELSSLEELAAAFDAAHERLYGVSVEGAQHEVVNLRVAVVGPQDDPARWLPTAESGGSLREKERRNVFDSAEQAELEAPVYDRSGLAPGDALRGPCVVDQLDSTTYIPSNWSATVDPSGNLMLEVERS